MPEAFAPYYKIREFGLERFQAECCVISTALGSFHFQDEDLSKALESLGEVRRPLTRNEIVLHLSRYVADGAACFDTLGKRVGLFRRQFSPQRPLDLQILTDAPQIMDRFVEQMAGETVSSITVSTLCEPINGKAGFNLVFLEDYRASSLNSVYELIKQPEQCILTSYIFGRSLLIDCLHGPSQAQPCHVCRRMRFKDEGFLTHPNALIETQEAIGEIDELDEVISRSLPLQPIERGLVPFYLFQAVKPFLSMFSSGGFHDEIINWTSIDLQTGRPAVTHASFHPLCGCWNHVECAQT